MKFIFSPPSLLVLLGGALASSFQNDFTFFQASFLIVVVAAVLVHTALPSVDEQLEQLSQYQFPAVARAVFRRENPRLSRNQEDFAFEGLKQYFALHLLERDAGRTAALGMPSVLVDEAWHAFVLCTEEYEAFCKKFFRCMIHHRPDPKSRPQRLSGETKFKDDVINTWTACQRARAAYPDHFTKLNDAPLLFALDGTTSHLVNGWVWSGPALSALAEQSERAEGRPSEQNVSTAPAGSTNTSEASGSRCSGACFSSAPAPAAGFSTGSSVPSSTSSSKSSQVPSSDTGSSCSSKSNSAGSSCGSNCSSKSSSGSGSSCGSSCSGGSSCGGGGGGD